MKPDNKKELLRKEMKKKRSSLDNAARNEKSRKIIETLCRTKEFEQSNTVFCYVSYMDEVETNLVINHILRNNLKLYVPKIINNEEMIAIRLSNLSDLEPDKIGILTPKTGEILLEPIDVVITPGLGFTRKCERLGYGRGYYDRWFSKNSVKTKIGVAFEIQITDNLPVEKTDVPMDMLITEKNTINMQ
ncbi:MAG: 5-formyltetrahydrofolate cyclo-ligase [Legionellales bacterium]|nr:5-formyltetrahydrofolate cyclo-ligase [Legionellales bacterium]